MIVNNDSDEMLIYPAFLLGLTSVCKYLNDESSVAIYYHTVLLFYSDGDFAYCFQACTRYNFF